jgi:hypothetical protein
MQCARTGRDCICELHKGCGLTASTAGDVRPVIEFVGKKLRLSPVAICMHDVDEITSGSDMFGCLDILVDRLLKVGMVHNDQGQIVSRLC